jgi:hypothetical protein
MAVSGADLIYWDTKSLVVLAILGLLTIWFAVLKLLFGSFSWTEITTDYANAKDKERRYEQLFRARNNILQHIGKARMNEEHAEARKLVVDLKEIEASIDAYEVTHYGRNPKTKAI